MSRGQGLQLPIGARIGIEALPPAACSVLGGSGWVSPRSGHTYSTHHSPYLDPVLVRTGRDHGVHMHTQPAGALPWPGTNGGPGAVTQQYRGGAVPGGERPEGPGEADGQ